MSQIGSFISAENGRITIMQNIFVRIGFGDEEKEGESTFYKEMRECANILNQCELTNKLNQLIIFDEICRGTSYEEGFALSEAIIEYLLKKKVYVLLSSHYLSLGKQIIDYKNARTLYTSYIYNNKNNNLEFLYKMKEGVTDLSFGVKVGEMAGLPKSIISRAEDILEKTEKNKKNIKN
jgi:DNA mismatch repair protein MutS